MCAIAGILKLKTSEEIRNRMLSTMQRRGPDETGVALNHDVSLLHARLTIIDPAGGSQPMTLNWAGETYTIVYNGELYNTQELRDELQKAGHHFLGHSDTEVVLHSYAQWGKSALDKFNGIFGLGIWEHTRKRLFLARDRMGVKPLFYKEHLGGFLFASEIKTILAYPTVKAEVDQEGIAQILLLGPGRTPGSGVFRGIKELEPGCCGYYTDGAFHWERYWKLTDREHTDTFEETVEKTRYLVTDAIKRQMVSDFPVGTFLSGGLDSSLISAVCANEHKNHNEILNTFSVDYENNDKYFVPGKFQPNSDNHYISVMQEHIGSNHHWCVLTPEMLVESLEDATYARDLPGMADVDFSLLAFCKDIRKYVKVALSGECADEIFGGYPWFRDPDVRALQGFPWAQNTMQRASLLLDKRFDAVSFVQEQYQDSLNQVDILPGTDPLEQRMKEMSYLNQRWFMQTLLDRKDRMSMYCGLEVRVPFCDYRIAEYLYSVPWKYKDYQGREKGLLRHAMQDILPNEVLWRKKSPYPKTYDPRYMELVRHRLNIVLADHNAPIHQIVDKNALIALTEKDSQWPWYGQLMKTPQTIAYMLQINHWMRKYRVDVV